MESWPHRVANHLPPCSTIVLQKESEPLKLVLNLTVIMMFSQTWVQRSSWLDHGKHRLEHGRQTWCQQPAGFVLSPSLSPAKSLDCLLKAGHQRLSLFGHFLNVWLIPETDHQGLTIKTAGSSKQKALFWLTKLKHPTRTYQHILAHSNTDPPPPPHLKLTLENLFAAVSVCFGFSHLFLCLVQ